MRVIWSLCFPTTRAASAGSPAESGTPPVAHAGGALQGSIGQASVAQLGNAARARLMASADTS
jgi:hypothetical protein